MIFFISYYRVLWFIIGYYGVIIGYSGLIRIIMGFCRTDNIAVASVVKTYVSLLFDTPVLPNI